VTMPEVGATPGWLVTTTVNVPPSWPGTMVPCDLAMLKDGLGRMIAGSVAEAVAAPPPETVAVFIWGDVALAATFTVAVITGYTPPPPSASLRVQVEPVQLQPVPAMDDRVSPDDRASVTVTVPLVAAAP